MKYKEFFMGTKEAKKKYPFHGKTFPKRHKNASKARRTSTLANPSLGGKQTFLELDQVSFVALQTFKKIETVFLD